MQAQPLRPIRWKASGSVSILVTSAVDEESWYFLAVLIEWVWSGTGVSDFLHTSPVTGMHVQVWGGTASRERFYGLLCAGSPPVSPVLGWGTSRL